ncbi:hypothetical protein Ahy_A06g027633 isoform D [Arachis hypogaea]|uniref:Uncharacterized protein n=1 Tax=Arachis hypogaea TaxID=3818 RepID=A0A445CPD6_ARAHY|nr:hypothetical protein Ahy_A06g027633 isoform D [Arachis hypogaea]
MKPCSELNPHPPASSLFSLDTPRPHSRPHPHRVTLSSLPSSRSGTYRFGLGHSSRSVFTQSQAQSPPSCARFAGGRTQRKQLPHRHRLRAFPAIVVAAAEAAGPGAGRRHSRSRHRLALRRTPSLRSLSPAAEASGLGGLVFICLLGSSLAVIFLRATDLCYSSSSESLHQLSFLRHHLLPPTWFFS